MVSKFQIILRQTSAGQTPVDTTKILGELVLAEGKALNVIKNDEGGFHMDVIDAPKDSPKAESITPEVVD